MGRVAMGVWALLGLGALNTLEEAVVIKEMFSAGEAAEAEDDKLSNKA